MKKGFFLLLVIVCTAFPLLGQGAFRLSATLDTNEVLIGDHVTLLLKIDFDETQGRVTRFPDLQPLQQFGDSIEILNEGKWTNHQRKIVFAAWDSGLYRIPKLPIEVVEQGETKTLYFNDVQLSVGNPPIGELAPIKAIEEEAWHWADLLPIVLWCVAIVLLLLVGFFLYQKLKNAPPKLVLERQIQQKPHEWATDQLQVLEQKQLWQQGKVKEYQSELTYIIRDYIEHRFGVQALESTSEELITSLKDEQTIDPFLFRQMEVVLKNADLVKFANIEPAAETHEQAMAWAKQFIIHTIPTETDLKNDPPKP